MAGALCLLVLSAGCGQTVEFRPYDADRFDDKSVLVLRPTSVLPLPEDILRNEQARVEQAIRESPYLSQVHLPADIRVLAASDTLVGSYYDVLSDFVSVLGITDREMVLAMQEKQPTEMLFSMQLFQLACGLCDQNDRLGLVASIHDARTAELLWRLHITEPISRGEAFADLSEEAKGLTDELIVTLDYLLKPKWHRLRFDHLRPAPQG